MSRSCSKPVDSIGKDFVFELAACVDEADIELEFGDVNAERWFGHDRELLLY